MSGVEGPPSADPSRLPEHKRADAGISPLSRRRGRTRFGKSAATTRLATKPGLELRDEVVEVEDGETRAVSWATAVREWRGWLAESMETRAVFEEAGTGEKVRVPLENRFMESRQKRLYAKLKDVERGARREFGDRLHTVMLTFTASTTSGAGQWDRAPGNHLDDLLGSWSAVRRALSRVLDGRRWEYVRMLEPHQSGHGHVHVGVFVDGPVSDGDFRPVMEAHVENCLPAGWEAHAPETDAVRVEADVSNVGAYLSEYVMSWGEEALEAPENVQKFHALMWATGRRRWSLSSGAQSWAAFDGPPTAGTWELTHIEVRGAEYPVEDGGSGVLRRTLDKSGAGLDPPPDRGGPS